MKKIFLGIGVLIVAAAIASVFWLYTKNDLPVTATTAVAQATTTSAFLPHRTPPAGQLEYYDEHYRFSFLYPASLAVQTDKDNGGAETFVFQDTSSSEGFEIFVVPYAYATITPAEFQKDEPSGVQNGLKNITIDGASGISFFGSDQNLGPTAEVWFIHGGYLYEVATLQPLASWLAGIMQTWEFL